MKRSIIVGIIAISLLTLLAACGGGDSKGDTAEQGTLAGKITIGPACAAEPCGGPPGAIYVGRDLILLRSGASSFKVPLGEDGSFSVELEPADYVIRMDGCNFAGCNDAFPMEKTIGAGETVTLNLDFDTGIRSPEQTGGIGVLVSDLVGLGSVVVQGKSISQPFFTVPGQEAVMDGEAIQVFTYPSPEAAQADADLVSPAGSPIGTSMVSWVEPPNFYLKDTLLVLYVGRNDTIIDRLQTVMGPKFAGVDAASSFMLPQVNPAATRADLKVEEYLALMDHAGRVLRVMGVAGLARAEQRQLGGRGLAEDHGAGLAQPGDRRGILLRTPAGVEGRAIFGRHVFRVEDVLDRDRQAVERADRPPGLAMLVDRLGLGQRVVRVQVGPGLDPGIDRLDARQVGGDQLLGGDVAAGQLVPRLARAQVGQLAHRP